MPRCIVIGATTRLVFLTSPLRDRCVTVHRPVVSSDDAMTDSGSRSSRILGVPISPEGAHDSGRCARGSPRIANRTVRRVRDDAQSVADGAITLHVARDVPAQIAIDELGLDAHTRRLLRAIIERFNGGPVGLSTLAAALADEGDAIDDVDEPWVLHLGFLQRTPRGRMAPRRAYDHRGLPSSDRTLPTDDERGPQQGTRW